MKVVAKHISICWIVVLAFSLIGTKRAQADILMIDLNGSSDEVAAAKKAAADRHEKFVLLPPRTDEQQANYFKIHQLEFEDDDLTVKEGKLINMQLDITDGSMKPKINLSKNTLEAQIDQVHAKRLEIENKRNDLIAKYPKQEFNGTDLDKAVTALSTSGRNFETVIISGHHGSEFFGYLGSLSSIDMSAAFKKNPGFQQSVRSLFAWGCYSATPAEAIQWQNIFPGLALVGGYDASAPGSGKLANTEFLSSILARDQAIQEIAAKPVSQLEIKSFTTALHDLPGFNESNAAACTRAACVGINSKTVKLTDLGKSCDTAGANLLTDEANDYSNKIYCDTQSSPLRTYYNHTRIYEHCADVNPTYKNIDPNQILRILFLKTILANFNLYYAPQIQELNERGATTCQGTSWTNFNLPMACIPDVSKNSTISINDLVVDLLIVSTNSCFNKELGDFTNTLRNSFGGGGFWLKFNPRCIPASWVEPATDRSQLEAPAADCNQPLQ